MWHILTSSKYTWLWKQIPKVEWDTQEETQQLESPHQLIFVARSHHCHQVLVMINNATNDSLAYWIVLWTLTYPVLLVKAMRLLVHLRNDCWVTDLCPTPTAFSVTQMDVRKSRKQSLYPNLNLDGGETVIKTNDGGFVAWWINEWQDCFLQKEARVCVNNMFRALRPSSSKNTSVRPSVSYHHEIKKLLPMTEVMSMQFKVRGQRSRSQWSKPNVAVSGP